MKFSKGSMWEVIPWEIDLNVEIYEPDPCAHCGPIYEKRHDKSFYDTKYCRCPRVVIAYNEGGYATTGVCLDCILEAAEKLPEGK